MKNRFIFTCGDINGIGPEIVIKTLNKISSQKKAEKLYFICSSNVFYDTIKNIQPKFDYEVVNSLNEDNLSNIIILNIGFAKQTLGKPTITSGKTAFKSLKLSYDLLEQGFADAVITAPISKTAIYKAGINFPGQTEMFAEWSGRKNFVMAFLSSKMNAALMTIHKPLINIPKLLKIKQLGILFNITLNILKIDLRISNPKIAVLGLNPHAGENGIIGREEIDIITPVIKKFSNKFSIEGPFSPDAFFGSKAYNNYDLVIGMYHDQVLIPFKLLNFGGGVNYTAGLPIVRTSPDHGVAYDIADKFIADESSMIMAYKYAKRIVNNRKNEIGQR
jgi:4-hydroxythreonine-4-phosphate dehydrogenase